ncbi:MAG: hypothetical protein ABIA75_09390 [Candidatus Neomarinimicrobiota bacterium]
MKKIIMKTISAGPDGCWQPGQKRECDEKTARDLVDHGFAEYQEKPAPAITAIETTTEHVVVEATIKPEPEPATPETAEPEPIPEPEPEPAVSETVEPAKPVKPKKSKSKK